MDVQLYRLRLQPLSDFGTPLVGDTLFGHLCWALRWRLGETGLTALLEGYAEGRPFAVLSDALPVGQVPRPSLPAARLRMDLDPGQRKADKRRAWLPSDQAGLPLSQAYALTGQVMVENMLWRDTAEGMQAFLEKRRPDWAQD